MHTRIVTSTHPGLFDPNITRRLWTWAKSDADSIVGTVPFHNAYIFLHTRQPPSAYPAKVPSALQRALLRATLRFGGHVNFAWAPEQRVLPPPASSQPGHAEWADGGEEAYCATAFSRRGGRLEIPAVSARNLGEVVQRLEAHASADPAGEEASEIGAARRRDDDVLDLYVCTHGERDCRCKEHGCAVYDALRVEVRRRGLEESVRVAGVGHVGGHKYVSCCLFLPFCAMLSGDHVNRYAANLLVYPYGEWCVMVSLTSQTCKIPNNSGC